MQHPAITGIHRKVGLVLAIAAAVLILLSTSAGHRELNLGPLGMLMGTFLLALSLIYFGVHAVGTLLYHQELMRSRLSAAVKDGEPF